jgi:hypothetical protein
MKPIDDDDARIHGRIDENAARGSKCRRGIGGHGRIILDWRKVMRGERGSPAAAGPSLSLSLFLSLCVEDWGIYRGGEWIIIRR